MKKIVLTLVLIIMLIASLFTLTGCEKDKEIVLKDDDTGYTTTFKHPESQKFEVTEYDQDSGRFATMTIKNEANNIDLKIYYIEESKSIYDDMKDSRKYDEGFKEYKWNNYEGYIYNADQYSLYFNILLQDETEDSEAIGLFGSVEAFDYENQNALESFNTKEFQNFMNSIEFKIEK